MDPVIVSVTDGEDYPIGVTITNDPGSLVDVSVTEPAATPIDVTVTQPAVNVIDVAVTENSVGPVEVAVTDGTPSGVQVAVTEIVPAPIEVDVKVLTGKQGTPGTDGAPGEAPFGVALPFFGVTPPPNFAFPVGQTLSRATYPDLAEVLAPDNTSPYWVDANDFVLPDARNRVLAGLGPTTWSDTMNKTGGSKDAVVAEHNHTTPPHNHSVNPPSASVSFSQTIRSSTQLYQAGSGSYVNAGGYGTIITASVNIGAFNSADKTVTVSDSGVDPTDKNLPPYLTCQYIMRLL